MKKILLLSMFITLLSSCRTKFLLPSGLYSESVGVYELNEETTLLDIYVNDSIMALIDTYSLKCDTVITLAIYSYMEEPSHSRNFIKVNTLEKYRNFDLSVTPEQGLAYSDSIDVNVTFANLSLTPGNLNLSFVTENNESLFSKNYYYNPDTNKHIEFRIPNLKYDGVIAVHFTFTPLIYKPLLDYFCYYNGLIKFKNESLSGSQVSENTFFADPHIKSLNINIDLTEQDLVRQVFINRPFMIFAKGKYSRIDINCNGFRYDYRKKRDIDYNALEAKVNEAIARDIP